MALSLLGIPCFPAVFPPSAHASSQPATDPKRTRLKNKKPAGTTEIVAPSPSPASPAPTPDRPATDPSIRQTWSVILAAFRGEDQEEAASRLLAKVRTEGSLPEAFVQRRDRATVIAVGAFADAASPEAHDTLTRVQAIEIAGEKPYVGSYLAPPPFGDMPGALPQYNLLRARDLYADKALYTLQIGVYARLDMEHPTEADLAEARRAAEQAAFRLRQEGELAFYRHGPRMSTVTVGVFDQSDFDPRTPSLKSRRLLDAQRRFPYNLYNGQAIRERIKGQGEGRLQPCNLVAIPRS